MADEDLGQWAPATVTDVAGLFAKASFPWWIAGGRAIELAVGRQLRAHGDLDVLVLRRDQEAAREHLAGWDLQVADPPGAGRLRPWHPGEVLDSPLHGVWCRQRPDAPWAVELLLDEAEDEAWVSRRDARVRLPILRVGHVTKDGVPYLSPEVQLFYKAKATRDKDEVDFEAALPLLSADQKRWLAEALRVTEPQHPWRDRLTAW